MTEFVHKYVLPQIDMSYPYLTNHIVNIQERGNHYYVLEMDDGKRILYDHMERTMTGLKNNFDPKEMDEPEWRDYFTMMLNRKMRLKGMSQKDLAIKSGIAQITIHTYTKGKYLPNIFYVHKLADALECDVADLTGFR